MSIQIQKMREDVVEIGGNIAKIYAEWERVSAELAIYKEYWEAMNAYDALDPGVGDDAFVDASIRANEASEAVRKIRGE